MKDITPGIAELAGAFAADGSMQKEHICFWGNILEDRLYYDIVLKSLFLEEFGVEVRPHDKKSNSVYGFYVCNKSIIKYFVETLGFKPGKKTYDVKAPRVIMKSQDPLIWAAFIRGFCDCDGTLSFGKRYGNYHKVYKIIHTYPRIQIKSVSNEIISDISELLNRLNIKHITCVLRKTRPNETDSKLIQISGVPRLEKWIDLVCFNNHVQFTKYEIFKNYGFVPPSTNIAQRQAILEGSIDPLDFYPNWPRSLAWIGRQDRKVPLKPSKL